MWTLVVSAASSVVYQPLTFRLYKMCSFLSRCLKTITRIKPQDEDTELDFLEETGRVSVLKSTQLLLGACFNSAVFIVIGIAVKCIAGPAMVLAVILGAVFTILNNLSLCELCSHFPTKTSFYAIIYGNVGELFAFIIAWFQLLQTIFMISVVSVSVGEYIYYVAQPPSDISWLPPHKMWAAIDLDTLVFSILFLVTISFIVGIGIRLCSGILIALFWINLGTFTFMFLLIVYYASTFHWDIPENFQPFKITGTVQGVAVTMFFFTHLDRIIERTPQFKKTDYVLPVSLGVSLLCVFVFFLCVTILLANLIPIEDIAKQAAIPKAFASSTFHDSKYVLSSVAFLIFVLTVIEGYIGAQRVLNLLVEDRLMNQHFSNVKKKTTVLTVLSIAFLCVPLFIWLPVISLIQGFCVASLIIKLIVNCSAVVIQYQPGQEFEEETSGFPNWKCSKNMILKCLLCCGYITQKKVLSKLGIEGHDEPTDQTSKIVNWSLLLYVPACLAIALALIYGLPNVYTNEWTVLGALIFLIIVIFLNFRVIMMQPRAKSFFFENDLFASLIPLINIGLSCILLVTLDWKAFCAVAVWTFLGKNSIVNVAHSDSFCCFRVHKVSNLLRKSCVLTPMPFFKI